MGTIDMPKKTITLMVDEYVRKRRRVKIFRHCIVPGWVANLRQCDKCHWEIKETDMLCIVETENGVLHLHEGCYE